MSAVVEVDLTDPTPPFEQLRRQFASLIESGRLVPGERLPTVRQLARDLDLAAGTVARAYRELEAAGAILTRRGGGTRVAPRSAVPVAEAQARLAVAAQQYALSMAGLGITAQDALAAVERAWPPAEV